MKEVRQIVRQELIFAQKNAHLDSLNEGFKAELASDAVQFVLGAAAEYGLGTITLPAYGAGLAVGPAVETVVDIAFTAKSVGAAVNDIKNISAKAGEYAGMLNDAVKSFGGGFDAFYDKVNDIVVKGLKELTDGDFSKVDEFIEDLKAKIKELISDIIAPIEKAIKIVIPDATIGLAAAKAVGGLLKSLSDNAYSALTSVIQKFDFLNDAITNPGKVVSFFKGVLEQIVELLKAAAEKIGQTSWVKAVMVGGIAGGAALKKLGPKGANKLADALKSASPRILQIIESVVKIIMPALFAQLAIFQIIMKGEYKEKSDGKEKKNESVALVNSIRKGRDVKITRRQLRRIIREAMAPNTPDVMGAIGGGKFQPRKQTDVLTTPEDFRSLKPGDNLSLNGRPIVVIGVSPMTGEVDYVDRGKATRKYFDYRLALADEPGEMPELDVVYLGPGEPPQNTRLPRR